MMIFVDAREIQGEVYGVGRYLKNLLREWSAYCKCFTLIFTRKPSFNLPYEFIILKGDGRWKWEHTKLRKFLNSRKESPYFTPGYTLPLAIKNPAAFVLHDISFIDHPEWFNPRERLKLKFLSYTSSKRASIIFTVSHFSKERIIERLKVPAHKIIIAQQGLDPEIRFDPQAAEKFREKYKIKGKIILYVGAIFRRRNVPLLIKAFEILKAEINSSLVLVGKNRNWPPFNLEEFIEGNDRIYHFNYLPQEELLGAYSAADLFVFLSEYEGFGMTPMEAIACNTPVILYPAEALKEIYGESVLYLEEKSPSLLKDIMLSILEDEELRGKIMKRAKERIKLYSWENGARKIKEALFELDPICNNSQL